MGANNYHKMHQETRGTNQRDMKHQVGMNVEGNHFADKKTINNYKENNRNMKKYLKRE